MGKIALVLGSMFTFAFIILFCILIKHLLAGKNDPRRNGP